MQKVIGVMFGICGKCILRLFYDRVYYRNMDRMHVLHILNAYLSIKTMFGFIYTVAASHCVWMCEDFSFYALIKTCPCLTWNCGTMLYILWTYCSKGAITCSIPEWVVVGWVRC